MDTAILLCGHGSRKSLDICLYALYHAHCDAAWRLFVICDDGQLAPPLANLAAGARLIASQGSFAADLSAGISLALAESDVSHVCLMHCDTVVTPHWLDKLLACSAEAVGPVMNRARSVQQVPVDLSVRQNRFSIGKINAFAEMRHAAFAQQLPVEAELDTPLLLLSRNAVSRLVFTHNFTTSCFTSLDISHQLTRAGIRAVCCRSCYVHHWGCEGQPGMSPYEKECSFHRDRRLFSTLWGPWRPDAGAYARSIALDAGWLPYAPADKTTRQAGLISRGMEEVSSLCNSQAAAAARFPCQMADGIYPEVPVRLLMQQLRHKAVRTVQNTRFMQARHLRRELRSPSGFSDLLAHIHQIKSNGGKVVAVLAPLYSDPTFSSEDGYIRRVKAIDEDVLDGFYKVYLYEPLIHLPQTLRIVSHGPQRAYVQYDPACAAQRAQVQELVQACGISYTHSLLRLMPHTWKNGAQDVLDLFSLPGVAHIFDMHGAVPEEFELAGQMAEAGFAQALEKRCVLGAQAIVAVNHAMEQHIRTRYPQCKAQIIVLPIFNEDILPDAALPEKPFDENRAIVLYAGGIQAWQKIDMMQDAMAAQAQNFSYKVFTPEPDAFVQQWADRPKPARLLLDCKTPQELTAEYLTAHYGFVLRDDITVNHVACPTKLIEYLQYGIIPILLSSKIGDFAAHGMQYVPIARFLEGNMPTETERLSMAQENHRVLARLLEDYSHGRQQLTGWLTHPGKEYPTGQ